jgi:hypothetical protein
MDHKGSISLLIFSLGVNRLFHGNGSSYPTIKTPWRPTQQLHMIPFKDWTKIQCKINQGNIFYTPISPSQKPQSSHKCNRYSLSLEWNKLHIHHFKIPKVITCMSCHITTLEILDTIIISLMLVPIEKHTRPLELFLTLGVSKIQSSKFFRSNSPNEVLFLTNYHSQNPNPTYTSSFQKIYT